MGEPLHKLSDFYPGVRDLLMGRTVTDAKIAEEIRLGILELTESYKFQDLETKGPIFTLVPFQVAYYFNFFVQEWDQDLDINTINSLWIYHTPYVPVTDIFKGNSGFRLSYKSIRDIEVLLNTPGMPMFWSRDSNMIHIASMPDREYQGYARYQHEHQFPNAGTASAGDDVVLMPNTWQDIIEYQAAMRIAQKLNLSSKASELHTRLYGDRQFETSRGVSGTPGLIFQRTSQYSRDQAQGTRTLRLRMGRH